MSTKGIVLVTGANGFIAARTVEALLNAGYSVRGSVRSAASAAALEAALAEHVASGRLTTVLVPDMTVPGAFDEAVRGVVAIAHLASPVNLENADADYVLHHAVRGTTGVLQSAAAAHAAAGTLRAVVLMSSIATIFRAGPKHQRQFWDETDWNDEAEAALAGAAGPPSGHAVYIASKMRSERAFWAFRDEHRGRFGFGFSMSSIHPVWVGGPPLILPADPEKLADTAIVTWKAMAGRDSSDFGPGNGSNVDVRDVARLVVFCVDNADAADGERYIAGGSGNYAKVQAQHDILRRAYPGRRDVIQEGKPGEGYPPDYSYPDDEPRRIDGSKAVKATGQNWIPFEKMVLDTAKAYEVYF